LDRQSIEKKALLYLDKFDASASRLHGVLTDFVRRRAQALGLDTKPYLAIVDETLERYQKNGLIDDRRFGAAMARALVARGASRQAIKSKLSSRGIAAEVIDEVVRDLHTEGSSELAAARALVKKRKLGNYRPVNDRRDQMRRDLGVLARAGFDFNTAKTALGVEGMDDEEGF
jgi:regulatory protein